MTATTCPNCRTPIRHIHDQPRAGIPVTIDAQPLTPDQARRQHNTGAKLYLDRGDWHPLDTHHLDHPMQGDRIHPAHTCPQQGLW